MPACPPNSNAPTTTITSVGKSVATLVKMQARGASDEVCTPSTPPAPDFNAWWAGMSSVVHKYPFAGYESWRNANAGCEQSRVDVYRALVTFNTASVANLKGLVQKAELKVTVRTPAASAGPGGLVTIGPLGQTGSVTLMCPTKLGGGGRLVRFGPNPGPLPIVSGIGEFDNLDEPNDVPFPAGTSTVYTFPTSGNAVGPLAGAAVPTTMMVSTPSGVTFTSDVTSQVVTALNSGTAGMSWMLTSNFEGPLPAPIPVGGNFDCKTAYDFELEISHF